MKYRASSIACIALACACTTDPGPSTGDGTAGSDTTAASTGPAETETDPSATGPDPTDGSGTAGMDTTAGVDTETGEEECPFPEPDAIECQAPGSSTIDFSLTLDGAPDPTMLDEACSLTSIADDGTTSTLQLDCQSGAVVIEISSTPHQGLSVAEGADLALFYYADYVDEANLARRLTLRRGSAEGALLFAAFDDTNLPSPAAFDVLPLELALPPSTCAPSLDGEFGIYVQATGLQVTFDGSTVEVFEGGDAYVGQLVSYRVLTGQVDRVQCFPEGSGFNYANWFVQAMFFAIPEG